MPPHNCLSDCYTKWDLADINHKRAISVSHTKMN